MAYDCESFRRKRDLETPAQLLTGHFLRHVHHEFAMFLIGLAQKTAKLVQVPGILARAAPRVATGLPLGKIDQFGRLFAVVEKLVHGNLESAGHFLQRFNGGNGMTIFHAGDIAPEQASTLLDVTLGEFLVFAEHAKTVANNHGWIIPSSGV
jgi:hypothetical protein